MLEVDASKIDLGWVSDEGWEQAVWKHVQTLWRSRDGLVHGNVTLRRIDAQHATIDADYFNFEQYGKWFDHPLRNPLTRLGAWIATSYGGLEGKQFLIKYNGNAIINQTSSITSRFARYPY